MEGRGDPEKKDLKNTGQRQPKSVKPTPTNHPAHRLYMRLVGLLVVIMLNFAAGLTRGFARGPRRTVVKDHAARHTSALASRRRVELRNRILRRHNPVTAQLDHHGTRSLDDPDDVHLCSIMEQMRLGEPQPIAQEYTTEETEGACYVLPASSGWEGKIYFVCAEVPDNPNFCCEQLDGMDWVCSADVGI